VAALLAAAGALAVGWAALAPLPAGSTEVVYTIPRGTAARRAAGERVSPIPARIDLTLGVRDTLLIRNDDDVEQTFGPVQLAPGQTYRIPFRAPATFDFACSAHDDGQLTIVVQPWPAAGWPRLRWRLLALTGAGRDRLGGG
jgi:hypothetical protein